jgi:hypothetical protein
MAKKSKGFGRHWQGAREKDYIEKRYLTSPPPGAVTLAKMFAAKPTMRYL